MNYNKFYTYQVNCNRTTNISAIIVNQTSAVLYNQFQNSNQITQSDCQFCDSSDDHSHQRNYTPSSDIIENHQSIIISDSDEDVSTEHLNQDINVNNQSSIINDSPDTIIISDSDEDVYIEYVNQKHETIQLVQSPNYPVEKYRNVAVKSTNSLAPLQLNTQDKLPRKGLAYPIQPDHHNLMVIAANALMISKAV